ncbi:MAG TPA: hypothetical protein ENN85_02300 [Methanoculleus sp.]|nr:hypothetical protein [Methanoculleus sp.]
MIFVTTSRKPAPELRTFGKDLAFTLEGHYYPRGKAGLSEILDPDGLVILVSKQGRKFMFEVYLEGGVVAAVSFSSFSVASRRGDLVRGLRTGNQTIYESLGRYLDVLKTEGASSTLEFDGPQRRHYILRLSQ